MTTPIQKFSLANEDITKYLADWEDVKPKVIQLEPKKHALHILDESFEKIFTLKFPLTYPALGDYSFESYRVMIPEELPTYIIMLVQAGASALGYFEDGEVVAHKADKKYMIRQKRGKAQLSYLKTRGKSKLGSRIRLANTVRFIEEINERLTDWEELYEVERLMYSCSATLWGMLFQAKTPPPFDKKDPRLIKIPIDVNVPTFEELQRINELVMQGEVLVWKEEAYSFFD